MEKREVLSAKLEERRMKARNQYVVLHPSYFFGFSEFYAFFVVKKKQVTAENAKNTKNEV